MRMTRALTSLVIAGLTAVGLSAADAGAVGSMVKDGDRIVFVGDSITGLGFNYGNDGYIKLIKAVLDEARPGSGVTVVPLGGSGQGVGSWQGVEKQSREKSSQLDVKGFDVKEELDKPASILVIMLGMNDSLSPYVSPDQAGIDGWAAKYKELIGSLRGRLKPRLTALGTVTPNTEDPNSPKNKLHTEMNKRLYAMAKELDCVVLPSSETVWDALNTGRKLKPDFHVTYDFVHPNHAGHAAIAIGMLKGLGEAAAAKIAETRLEKQFAAAKGQPPALSYTIIPQSMPTDSDQVSFDIVYHWTPAGFADKSEAKATLQAPAGLKPEPAELVGVTGVFKVTGKLDHLVNTLKLSVKDGAVTKDVDIAVPAPWLVATGFANNAAWEMPKQAYVPEKGALPGEELLMKGLDFNKTPEGWKGAAPRWSKYLASVDHTGGNTPGNVGLYASTFAAVFEAAFGARWIHSDKECPVTITMGNRTFAGQIGLRVWMNGECLYSGVITAEPNKKVEKSAALKKGWNCLVFKSNHCTWQWQFSIDMACQTPEETARLLVSTVPQN